MKIMRKIMAVVLIIIIATSFCYASVIPNTNDVIQPYYVGTQAINQYFQISSSGKATMEAFLTPKSTALVDEVKVSLIIKNNAGASIYNKTYTAEYNRLFNEYQITKNYQLPSKGSYQFQAIYKCYKNGSLVETINSSYMTDSY